MKKNTEFKEWKNFINHINLLIRLARINKINKIIIKEVEKVNLQSKEEGEALKKVLNGIVEYQRIVTNRLIKS